MDRLHQKKVRAEKEQFNVLDELKSDISQIKAAALELERTVSSLEEGTSAIRKMVESLIAANS